jgi:hypothetical protein
MSWVEVATQRDAIARLLAKHGLGPQPPPLGVSLAALEWSLALITMRASRALSGSIAVALPFDSDPMALPNVASPVATTVVARRSEFMSPRLSPMVIPKG